MKSVRRQLALISVEETIAGASTWQLQRRAEALARMRRAVYAPCLLAAETRESNTNSMLNPKNEKENDAGEP